MAWFGFGNKKKADADAENSPDAPVSEAVQEPTSEPEEKKGWFQRFRQAVQRTRRALKTDIRDLLSRKTGELVDDDFLQQLFAILVKTDMGGKPAKQICDRVGREFRNRKMEMDELLNSVKDELRTVMEQEETQLQFADSGPTVILVVGVNGSGKTTSIAKLAYHMKNDGYSVVLGAGDTFRAAAVEQLTIWSERIGVDIVKGQTGGDPASVAHQAVERAVSTDADVCIIDTAGRLQTQVNLMKQLEKIHRVIQKQVPDAPHEVLLVLDATAGQNGISQAKGFSEAAACTGIVLAKLDGTAKGGVVVPIRQEFGLPVKFIGQGEKETDLAVFRVEQFLDDLFEEVESPV